MDSKKLKLPENTTVHSQSLKKIQGTFIQSIPNSDAPLHQLLQAAIYTS